MRADHPGSGLPHAPPSGDPPRRQAAGGDDAEVPAASQARHLDPGRSGQRFLPDRDPGNRQPGSGRRSTASVLCSGKVYYDLLEKRRAEGREDTAIVRIEQLYPFPEDDLAEVLARTRTSSTSSGVRKSR
ncbi:hypothetical protein ACPA9J_07330 [Pseudomonas aeruginosa]